MAWRYDDPRASVDRDYADPHQAFEDVREAHAWATRELATAEPQSTRVWVLTEEQKRLAGLSYEIKRQF
jgi:hypothetical protein